MADKESEQLTEEVQNLIAARELYKVSVADNFLPLGYGIGGGGGDLGIGRALRGYIVTTFATLCEMFGPPSPYPNLSAEWLLCFEDDRVVSIYIPNLKFIPKLPYLWYVGGRSLGDVERVAAILQTGYYLNRKLADQPESYEAQF